MSFATTIPVAIKVAGMLADGYKYIKDHPEEIQQAMDEAAKAAAAAKKLAGDAADFLDVDEHMAKAKLLAADAAAILTSDRSEDPEVKKAREEARKAEAEAAKALTEARQAILESADLRTTIPKLVDKLASADDEALALYMNTLDAPGCYVITTYDKIDLDKDLTQVQAERRDLRLHLHSRGAGVPSPSTCGDLWRSQLVQHAPKEGIGSICREMCRAHPLRDGRGTAVSIGEAVCRFVSSPPALP